MSTYSDASLIYYPSGYKAGTAYSLKPTDGSGDLTFTRASTATRVNKQGLIEGVRTNLILESNSFDTTWTNTSTTETSGQSGYDGTNNAWLLTKPATSFARIQQSFSSTSGLKTFSVYLKAGTLSWCRVLGFTSAANPNIYVNLSNGSLGSQYNNISATSTDVGAGWYRVSLTFDASISEIRIYPADANDSVSGISGSIYIQDAQLEASVQATEYIPTTTTAVSVGMLANVPRIDYTGGGCGKLLLEPQRTNSLTYSEQFNDASWVKVANPTITANATTSPDGTTNADKLIPSTSVGRQAVSQNNSSTGAVSMSVYAKKGEYDIVQLTDSRNPTAFANFDLTNGVLGSVSDFTATIVSVGSGWYRCSISYNYTLSLSAFRISVQQLATSVRLPEWAGNGTDGIYIWGAQLELGSYATSYIPTTSTAVTRLADTASKTGISSLINDSEGVLYAEISALADDLTYRILSISDGTTAERIYMQYTNATNTVAVVIKNGSTTQANMNYALSDETELAKVAIKYKANDFALWVNGFEVGTDASGTTPTGLSELAFDDGGGGNYFYGNCQSLMIFPTALSDDDLTLLTGTLGETYFQSYALMANYLNYTIQ